MVQLGRLGCAGIVEIKGYTYTPRFPCDIFVFLFSLGF